MTGADILFVLKNVSHHLEGGEALTLGDLTLNLVENNKMEVIGCSNYIHLENLTKKQSLIELAEVKELFQRMQHSSKELSDFVEDKAIIYSLHYDDSGKGGIAICSEDNGEVIWKIELQEY